MKKRSSNTYLLNFFFIAIIGAIIIGLTIAIGGEGIVDVLSDISFSDLLIVVVAVLVWQSIIALILVILTRISHPKYPLFNGYINAFVAALFHSLTPSASGGQIAQFYVYKKQGVDVGNAGSVLWMEFVIYQVALTLLSFFFIVIRFNTFVEYSNLYVFVILGFIINASVIVFLVSLARFRRLHDWIKEKGVYIGVKLHLVKDPEATIANIDEQLERFRNETGTFGKHKLRIASVFLLNILRLLVYYAVPCIVFLVLRQPIDIDLLIDCIAMGSFVAITSSMIPIPGASCGTETIFVLMFSNLFDSTIVGAGMLLWRFATFYFVMIIGTVCFTYIKYKKTATDISKNE